MTRASDEHAREATLDVVVEMLESGGYDAVRLQDVAKRARLSLAKIYKLFPSRQELIVSAMERWMTANVYADMTMPRPEETTADTLVRVLRTVFEPWERAPHMLQAYHRAVTGPGGERLEAQGWALVEPVARPALKDTDPEVTRDLETILLHLVYGLIGRFTDGKIPITDILPILERAIHRLTGNHPSRTNNQIGRRPEHATSEARRRDAHSPLIRATSPAPGSRRREAATVAGRLPNYPAACSRRGAGACARGHGLRPTAA